MTVLVEQVRRLYGNEARFSVGECIFGRLENRRTCTTATDPPFRNRTIRQNDCLCAGLGGRRRHRAHDGRKRKRFAGRLACRDDAQDVGGAIHQILAR
jgi:hypothetical protein